MGIATEDTIVALASARGNAGVAVIRISGPQTAAILAAFGGMPAPRQAALRTFKDAEQGVIDQGLLLWFPGPKSFTGEDCAELQVHGGMVVVDRLIARAIELGARHALPGEFSQRAYLNGKLDLAQAEAIADLISAQSLRGAQAAQRSLRGEFSQRVEALAQSVLQLRVYVEAAIDFPDEDVDFLADERLHEKLQSLDQSLVELRTRSRQGAKLHDGFRVALIGRPNAGKSSLLNALAGDDTAIVTATAGTTRDALAVEIMLDGLLLTLVDTAGIREASDDIEAEGVRRSGREIERADHILLIEDASELPDPLAVPADKPVTRVHNKIDLDPTVAALPSALQVSAKYGHGLDELRSHLFKLAGGQSGDGEFSARTRHIEALDRAIEHVQEARELLDQGLGDLAAELLLRAHHALGEITGRVDSDALLGEIFASFCIGK